MHNQSFWNCRGKVCWGKNSRTFLIMQNWSYLFFSFSVNEGFLMKSNSSKKPTKSFVKCRCKIFKMQMKVITIWSQWYFLPVIMFLLVCSILAFPTEKTQSEFGKRYYSKKYICKYNLARCVLEGREPGYSR